jgi:hypothetical protein
VDASGRALRGRAGVSGGTTIDLHRIRSAIDEHERVIMDGEIT